VFIDENLAVGITIDDDRRQRSQSGILQPIHQNDYYNYYNYMHLRKSARYFPPVSRTRAIVADR